SLHPLSLHGALPIWSFPELLPESSPWVEPSLPEFEPPSEPLSASLPESASVLLPESLPDPLPESSCGCSAGPVDTSIVTVSPFWKSYPLFPERTSATVPAARSDSTSTELTSRPSCSRLRVAEASDCPMYALGSIVIVSSSCVASAVGVPVGCGAGSPVPPKKIHPTQAR